MFDAQAVLNEEAYLTGFGFDITHSANLSLSGIDIDQSLFFDLSDLGNAFASAFSASLDGYPDNNLFVGSLVFNVLSVEDTWVSVQGDPLQSFNHGALYVTDSFTPFDQVINGQVHIPVNTPKAMLLLLIGVVGLLIRRKQF